MAILNNGIPTNITEYPNSFKRQGAFPLEAYSVFYDTYNNDILTKSALDNAKDYAKNNKVAYVGQQLITVSQGTIRLFVIANETGELVEYVKQNDYATKDKGGTVKINPNYGLITFDGSLRGFTKTGDSYTKADTSCLISKGTLNPLLNNKQDTLVSGTNIKTINGQSILGRGNITIEGGSGGPSLPPLFVERSADKSGYATHTAKEIYEYVQQGGEVFFQGSELCYIYGNEDDDEYAAEFCYTSGEECYLDCYTINKDGSIDNYERWFATNSWVSEEIAKNQVHTMALNGKKEKEFQGWLEITDMAIFDHLEVSPQAGEESMPTHITIANLDEFNKIHIRNSNNSIPTISIYDDYSGTTTTKTLNNRYYYINTVGDITIDDVDVNPNTRQSDIFVWVTEFYEGNVLRYSIDAYVSEDNDVGVTGTYNTSTKTYNISKNLKKLSNRIVIFARDTNGTCKLVAKYLQKSNIENSIGDRSLTQTFDPGYTYVKIASKNPLVRELGLDLTDTTPMGATGEYAASFGGVSAALGKRSFACGTNTVAKGKYSLASGDNAIAYGNESFTSGYNTLAKGVQTAAFGYKSAAIGPQAFVIGRGCIAGGPQSFAGGQMSKTYDDALRSFAFGDHCRADFNDQFVVGRYNEPLGANTLFAVGTGTANALNTMFSVGMDGAYVDGQRVVTTVDLSNSESNIESKTNEKIKGINDTLDKTTEEDTVVHIDNILNTKSVKIDSTVTENYFFSKDYIKTVKTVNVTTSFYASSINIHTENISIDEFSVKTPGWGDTGYRYLLLRTGQNYDGSNSILTIGINQYNTEIPIDTLLPSNQYMLIIKQDSTGYTFLHMFDYTHRVDWVKGTSLENLPYPDCYVVVHKSQINQSRGRITASWSKCGQYEVLENRIKVIEKDLSTLIKFFKDSDTDGVLPPFTLGG